MEVERGKARGQSFKHHLPCSHCHSFNQSFYSFSSFIYWSRMKNKKSLQPTSVVEIWSQGKSFIYILALHLLAM